MSYEVSEKVDAPNIFLAKFSELSGQRFDPFANQPRRYEIERIIKVGNYEVCPLIQVVDWQKKSTTEIRSEDTYIGLENIDGRTGFFIAGKERETISTALKFSIGDILFPKLRPYLNKTHLAKFSGICSTEFHVFKAKGLLPEYLVSMLRSRLLVELSSMLMTGNTLPRLQTADIERFSIPVPPLKIQQQIVSLLQVAHIEKQQREVQARKMLDSIDDVLLAELAITPQPEPPKNIENRIFQRKFSQVTGQRIDAPANWKRIRLNSKKFPSRKLLEVCEINPSTTFPKIALDELVSFVPMENVSEFFGEIAVESARALGESKTYTTFQNNDLIWAKITPCMENGKSAIAERLLNGFGFGSTEFHVFRPKTSELSIQYLHLLLRLKTVREYARLSFTGSSGHQRVDEKFFRQLEIPMPPPDIQVRLVGQVNSLKQTVEKLQKEANAQLEAAKHEIEAMILGGTTNS